MPVSDLKIIGLEGQAAFPARLPAQVIKHWVNFSYRYEGIFRHDIFIRDFDKQCR